MFLGEGKRTLAAQSSFDGLNGPEAGGDGDFHGESADVSAALSSPQEDFPEPVVGVEAERCRIGDLSAELSARTETRTSLSAAACGRISRCDMVVASLLVASSASSRLVRLTPREQQKQH